jgi:hypothetical protein
MSALQDEAVTGAGRQMQARANQFQACGEADDPGAEQAGDEIVTRTAGFKRHVNTSSFFAPKPMYAFEFANGSMLSVDVTNRGLDDTQALGAGCSIQTHRDIPLTEPK